VSPAIEPGVRIKYKFKSFILGLHAGYLLDLAGKLHLDYSDFRPAYFYDFGEVRANWSGFRIGIFGGFTL
jgi:hypothetical protein